MSIHEQKQPFFDVAQGWLKKKGEELCGDKIAIWKDRNQTLLILADGLGSGVKANILATLTTKIALTMLRNEETVTETMETILRTLPICKVRGIAYCTVTIIQVDRAGLCRIFEFDNPPVFILRGSEILSVLSEEKFFAGKKVLVSEFQMVPNDVITMVSDGVIHAGLGITFNHGWEWTHVRDYLCRNNSHSAGLITTQLLDACNRLYGGFPGDDTSVATLIYMSPQETHLLIGPPLYKNHDASTLNEFAKLSGNKILCGGTTANIASRELHRELWPTLDYPDPNIPPIARMKGFDLVTEGIITLNRALVILERYADNAFSFDASREDGATLICKNLIHNSTHINFWIGTAENEAHLEPDFIKTYLSKPEVITRMVTVLKNIGKEVSTKMTL